MSSELLANDSASSLPSSSGTTYARSNTIIVTDPLIFTHDENNNGNELLEELISNLKLNFPQHELVKFFRLKRFKRLMIVFENLTTASNIYKILVDHEIQCGFALRDTDIKDLNRAHRQHLQESRKHDKGNGDVDDENGSDVGEEEEILNSMSHGFENNLEESGVRSAHILLPPKPVVQFQSPPPSPYLGFVHNKLEEPPDDITMTNPKDLAHILYQPTEDLQNKEKVFDIGTDINDGYIDDSLEIADFSLSGQTLVSSAGGAGAQPFVNSDSISDDIPILLIDRDAAKLLRKQDEEQGKL
ncbi:unnamed protein product [[Candida] boidinii]|uniref:Unnamed protein product n=1 Tax=Candida boidinii TaxID=5477 RepID=A0A9W6SZX4_CANBO|nr:hypothetical protein B5S30_g79 [[Candida] boidinii]OWB82065.1 hypothetical protein B5S33_g686 [[Candida] boidinii]GME69710.1 unnamed protein product [[Candida] boidinii]GMF53463.1 unnamed protein product [[Candida] boidinii]GMF98261.1 unnamed protein product [[Candida] boidinii]